MILIGTIHSDLEGPKRLEYLLNKFNPKIITIEFPDNFTIEEAEKFISNGKNQSRKEIKGFGLPENSKRLNYEGVDIISYECIVPIEYSKKSNSNIYFVDHPDISSITKKKTEPSKTKINKLKELYGLVKDFSYEDLRRIIVENFDKAYNDKDILKMILKYNPLSGEEFFEKEFFEKEFQEKREQYMANKIIKIHPDKNDIHVGGMGHIFGDYDFIEVKLLYERLGNLVTKRIRLCDAYNE